MPSLKALSVALTAAIALCGLASPAAAQSSTTNLHTFTVSLLGGVGGSIDEDAPGYDNSAFQLGGSVVTEDNVEIGVRVGRLSFGSETTERVGQLFDAELTYGTIAGEYTFGEMAYQSGLYVGLGFYRLEGTQLFTGNAISTNRVGVTFGATGEFDLSKRVGILGELSAHALPSGEAQFFTNALIGVAIYFE